MALLQLLLVGCVCVALGEDVAETADLTPMEQEPISAAIETRLKATEDQIEALKMKLEGQDKVVFSATLRAPESGPELFVGPFNVEHTLVFKNIHTNIGDGYKSGTGIFTAPVKGFYYFSFGVASWGKNYLGVMLKKNGETITSVYSDAGGDHSRPGANSVILHLDKMDQCIR
ncbi:hypothetical protein AGOR_G00032370 [Albula goreensis]|uniref:C1q domain-containing protein n=1 Tax=Albula goreensis TaxID=1534307 RepID=A0A8T3E2W8_9TELE|nr:hypothetical protein AGOR_G00032370 [Albula goreensis]